MAACRSRQGKSGPPTSGSARRPTSAAECCPTRDHLRHLTTVAGQLALAQWLFAASAGTALASFLLPKGLPTDQSLLRPTQQIFRVRREYNIWVGNQTLEDFALRFTALKARRWSIERVALTALGATAFLALEAIAASVTLSYGFTNFVWAMLTVGAVIFITGLPITYHAARHGLDIDLLTRGAGFGYLGSTLTSLIYASFTFIFFAIEAAILASALEALLGIPPAIGYVLCALAVIPVVTHGITAISRFQIGTQGFWLSLQCLALGVAAWFEFSRIDDWSRFAPEHLESGNSFNLLHF